MSISFVTGLVTFIIGSIYTLLSLNLPLASIGRSYEPKIFPTMLGILMIILSLTLIGQELKKIKSKSSMYKKIVFKFDNHLKNIILTVLNTLLYSFLFAKAGYVIATFIFVGLELILFSSFRKWKSCALIAFIFSLTVYILFNKLLGVYLPNTPYIGL